MQRWNETNLPFVLFPIPKMLAMHNPPGEASVILEQPGNFGKPRDVIIACDHHEGVKLLLPPVITSILGFLPKRQYSFPVPHLGPLHSRVQLKGFLVMVAGYPQSTGGRLLCVEGSIRAVFSQQAV